MYTCNYSFQIALKITVTVNKKPKTWPSARKFWIVLDMQASAMASMIYADLDGIDDESERQKIREGLGEYCKLDTLAMVMIWQALSRIAEIS